MNLEINHNGTGESGYHRRRAFFSRNELVLEELKQLCLDKAMKIKLKHPMLLNVQ